MAYKTGECATGPVERVEVFNCYCTGYPPGQHSPVCASVQKIDRVHNAADSTTCPYCQRVEGHTASCPNFIKTSVDHGVLSSPTPTLHTLNITQARQAIEAEIDRLQKILVQL